MFEESPKNNITSQILCFFCGLELCSPKERKNATFSCIGRMIIVDTAENELSERWKVGKLWSAGMLVVICVISKPSFTNSRMLDGRHLHIAGVVSLFGTFYDHLGNRWYSGLDEHRYVRRHRVKPAGVTGMQVHARILGCVQRSTVTTWKGVKPGRQLNRANLRYDSNLEFWIFWNFDLLKFGFVNISGNVR